MSFTFIKSEDSPKPKIRKKSGRPKGVKNRPKVPPVGAAVSAGDIMFECDESNVVEYLPIPDDITPITGRLGVPLHDLLPYNICFHRGYQYPMSPAEVEQADRERFELPESLWLKKYGVGSIYRTKAERDNECNPESNPESKTESKTDKGETDSMEGFKVSNYGEI